MDTADKQYVPSFPMGKIKVEIEWDGKRRTLEAELITEFDFAVDYEKYPRDITEIVQPAVEKVTISFNPIKNSEGLQYTVREEDLEPKKRVYKNGKVVFPRQALGGSISRFEDRKRQAMLALMELGIDNVVARKPAILQATNHFRCTPKLGSNDYFTAKEGDTVEIKDGKVMITSHNGSEKTGWLVLP